MRKGVQLIVMNDRLFAERTNDERILRFENFSDAAQAGAGRSIEEMIRALASTLQEVDRGDGPGRTLALVKADAMAVRLSQRLNEGPDAVKVRGLLSRYGAKMGAMTPLWRAGLLTMSCCGARGGRGRRRKKRRTGVPATQRSAGGILIPATGVRRTRIYSAR